MEDPRICYVTASYPFGSGEAFVGVEIDAWRKRGYSIFVMPAYPRGARSDEFNGMDGVLNYPVFSFSFFASVLYWVYRSPTVIFGIFSDLFKSPDNLWKNLLISIKAFACARELVRQPCSHIHAHWGGTSSTMAMVMSRLTGVPWSLTCHRWDIYANNLLRLKSESAQFARFISNRGRSTALGLGVAASKSVVIHMGVSSVENLPIKLEPSPVVVIACPANLIEVKGHRYLIEAALLMKKAERQFLLRFFGDGVLRLELERYCSEMNVLDLVRFEGHCPHTKLMKMYRAGEVDLVVLPSVELNDVEHEGVPVALMEAMRFGIPVVSTRTGSIPELLPDHLSLTVAQQDAVALCEKIEEIAFDRVRYQAAAAAVLAVMNNDWSMDAAVGQMERIMFNGEKVS